MFRQAPIMLGMFEEVGKPTQLFSTTGMQPLFRLAKCLSVRLFVIWATFLLLANLRSTVLFLAF